MTVRNTLIKFDFKKIFNIFLFIICILGVITSIRMNLANRSFWLDEQLLSYSFSTRNIFNMWIGEMEGNQSAPLGWLYLVKIFSLIFGNTEFFVRIPSIIFFLTTLLLTYYFSKEIINISYPMAPCAFLANMPFLLRYSNMFKPYIADCTFVLLVFITFFLYANNKIKLLWLCIIWSILIWFSNPVCFFEGGLIISYFLYHVFYKKDELKIETINLFILGVSIVFSFVISYFLWLKVTANSPVMINYWKDSNFPLIPTSVSEIKRGLSLVADIFEEMKHYYLFYYMYFASCVLSLYFSIKNKDFIFLGAYIGIGICLFASWLGMFPVATRLWCFIYPLIIIMFFYAVNNLFRKIIVDKYFDIVLVIIGFLIIISNNGISYYLLDKEHTYLSNEEINTELEYLDNNIKDNDIVYVRVDNIFGFMYKNGYDNNQYKNTNNKVIFGTTDYSEDVKNLAKYDSVYIVSSHVGDSFYDDISELNNYGTLEIVSNRYNTPLFHYYKTK